MMNEVCDCPTYRDHLLRPCYTFTAQRTKWQRDHEKPPQIVREAEQVVDEPTLYYDPLRNGIWKVY